MDESNSECGATESALVGPFKGLLADSVAAAAVGFTFGDLQGATAGALVPLGERLIRLSHSEFGARSERGEVLVAIAAQNAGMTPEELMLAVAADPDRRHLAWTAANAASSSRYSARIVALGRALANGVLAEDEALLDQSQLVVNAMAELDRPHVLLLSKFANIEGDSSDPVFVRRTLSWPNLQKLLPNYDRSLYALLALVERHGLVLRGQQTVDGGTPVLGTEVLLEGEHWSLTDFGYLVLDELWRAGAQDVVHTEV